MKATTLRLPAGALLLAVVACAGTLPATAPAPADATAPAAAPPSLPASPPADPADVGSIDAIIAALYDAISGPVGQPRDWDRFRSLFVPGARLIPTGPAPGGEHRHQVLTVEDYIRGGARALADMGFRERELARRTERFAAIAHAFSSYEAFRGDETEPFMRGVNSFQLFHDGARWWVVTVFWAPEHPGAPLPEEYLP